MHKRKETELIRWESFDIRLLNDAEYSKWYSLMGKDKKSRVDRFRFADDKKRTVAGEMLARRMIGEQCCVSPETIIFDKTEGGKPFAVGLDVHFSISHSGDWAVCALAHKPVGIDIEIIRTHTPEIIQRVCSDGEYQQVILSSDPDGEFTRIWTAKEAYVKCLGAGLGSWDIRNVPSDKADQFKLDNSWVSIVSL